MSRYNFNGQIVAGDDPRFVALLREAHGVQPRPRCLCRPEGVEMYVARLAHQFIIKRMPGSGSLHALHCKAYESPLELSGLGAVLGGAVRTDVNDGQTLLRLAFPLSKATRFTSTAGGATLPAMRDEVSSEGSKLSLRGLLHYLWGEAGLHRWSPAMAGKRNWFVVRKYLLLASEDKRVRGQPLADLLFIPEGFTVEKKEEIAMRRAAQFARFAGSGARTEKLFLVIGEMKELAEARIGKKIILKHVPDQGFMLRPDIAQRFVGQFATELEFWNARPELHLLVCATCSMGQNGVASVETATVMLANEQWIPVEGQFDKTLVDHLVHAHRRFEKCLRYNLPVSEPLACAVLADRPEAVALYLLPAGAPDDLRDALAAQQRDSAVAAWSWESAQAMPALPPPISALRH